MARMTEEEADALDEEITNTDITQKPGEGALSLETSYQAGGSDLPSFIQNFIRGWGQTPPRAKLHSQAGVSPPNFHSNPFYERKGRSDPAPPYRGQTPPPARGPPPPPQKKRPRNGSGAAG
jgi:hypothetical protein